MMLPTLRATVRTSRGMTLIELLVVLGIGFLVASILYMLVDASTRGGRVVAARISGQEEGRRVLSWVADRLRQVNYDPLAACAEGLLQIGNGQGFAQRLAFRAIIDADAIQPRRVFVFYRDGDTLWQETRVEVPGQPCDAEALRLGPDPGRTALTRPLVKDFQLQFFGKDGQVVSTPEAVRSIGLTLSLGAASTRGQVESQTYQSLVTLRAP